MAVLHPCHPSPPPPAVLSEAHRAPVVDAERPAAPEPALHGVPEAPGEVVPPVALHAEAEGGRWAGEGGRGEAPMGCWGSPMKQ